MPKQKLNTLKPITIDAPARIHLGFGTSPQAVPPQVPKVPQVSNPQVPQSPNPSEGLAEASSQADSQAVPPQVPKVPRVSNPQVPQSPNPSESLAEASHSIGMAVDFARLKLKIGISQGGDERGGDSQASDKQVGDNQSQGGDSQASHKQDEIIAPNPAVLKTHLARWRRLFPQVTCQFKVEVLSPATILPHSGLGSGTQLVMSLAYGLGELSKQAGFGITGYDLVATATQMGRQKRSVVGTNGWLGGGFIVGNRQGASRFSINRWRVVLLLDTQRQGIFGMEEERLFANLAPPQLPSIAKIVAALRGEDFTAFAEAVTQTQQAMAATFQNNQLFMSRSIRAIAHHLPKTGVGQSSWGPTAFAFVPNHKAALALVDKIKDAPTISTAIVRPDNRGAIKSR